MLDGYLITTPIESIFHFENLLVRICVDEKEAVLFDGLNIEFIRYLDDVVCDIVERLNISICVTEINKVQFYIFGKFNNFPEVHFLN